MAAAAEQRSPSRLLALALALPATGYAAGAVVSGRCQIGLSLTVRGDRNRKQRRSHGTIGIESFRGEYRHWAGWVGVEGCNGFRRRGLIYFEVNGRERLGVECGVERDQAVRAVYYGRSAGSSHQVVDRKIHAGQVHWKFIGCGGEKSGVEMKPKCFYRRYY